MPGPARPEVEQRPGSDPQEIEISATQVRAGIRRFKKGGTGSNPGRLFLSRRDRTDEFLRRLPNLVREGVARTCHECPSAQLRGFLDHLCREEWDIQVPK